MPQFDLVSLFKKGGAISILAAISMGLGYSIDSLASQLRAEIQSHYDDLDKKIITVRERDRTIIEVLNRIERRLDRIDHRMEKK